MRQIPLKPQLVLPKGTQVVTRDTVRTGAGAIVCPAGTVGTVIETPVDDSHSYRVALPNGRELSLKRRQLRIRKHAQEEDLNELQRELEEVDLYRFVIYRCTVGSRAYGLDDEDSDTDRRGIYLPPAELHWSLFGVPEQLENRDAEECYWELEKFLKMALKANPNILECLYTPVVETLSPLAEELRGMRSAFLSQRVYETYNGYVLSQFKRLEQDVRATGTLKWKHAMHLVRLLLAGATVLQEGFVPVEVAEHRERLLAIKRGRLSWQEVNEWRLELHEQLDRAFAGTRLPEQPDYRSANDFLVRARRNAL